jgi:hypothetical protein
MSASPVLSSEPYPFRDVQPYLKRVFEAFGRERCYWGTDLTWCRSRAIWRRQKAPVLRRSLSLLVCAVPFDARAEEACC